MNRPNRSRLLACASFAMFMLWSDSATAGLIEAMTSRVPDRVDFDAPKNVAVHKIAILWVQPMRHFVVETSTIASAAFAGLIEGAIEGGVNGSHSNTYVDMLKTKSVAFGPKFQESLLRELSNDGYEVTTLKQSPRLKEDKKTVDYSGIHADADALLSVWYAKTGYLSPMTIPDYSPTIVAGVKLIDAHTYETLFFKTFDVTPVASHVSNKNVDAFVPNEKYRYADFDALMAHFDDSVLGLLDSQDQIALHVAQQLKPAFTPAPAQPAAAASAP